MEGGWRRGRPDHAEVSHLYQQLDPVRCCVAVVGRGAEHGSALWLFLVCPHTTGRRSAGKENLEAKRRCRGAEGREAGENGERLYAFSPGAGSQWGASHRQSSGGLVKQTEESEVGLGRGGD